MHMHGRIKINKVISDCLLGQHDLPVLVACLPMSKHFADLIGRRPAELPIGKHWKLASNHVVHHDRVWRARYKVEASSAVMIVIFLGGVAKCVV